jgi:hypothetical protein
LLGLCPLPCRTVRRRRAGRLAKRVRNKPLMEET